MEILIQFKLVLFSVVEYFGVKKKILENEYKWIKTFEENHEFFILIMLRYVNSSIERDCQWVSGSVIWKPYKIIIQ